MKGKRTILVTLIRMVVWKPKKKLSVQLHYFIMLLFKSRTFLLASLQQDFHELRQQQNKKDQELQQKFKNINIS